MRLLPKNLKGTSKYKLLSLLLFAAFLFIFIYESYPKRILNKLHSITSHKIDPRYNNKVDLFTLIDSCKTVFIGNSIIERAPWSALVKDDVCNMGIGRDITARMFSRVDLAIATNPKNIVILGGINDVNSGIPADSTINNLIAILGKIKENQITAVYQMIIPVAEFYPNSEKVNEKIRVINDHLVEYCKKNSIQVVTNFSISEAPLSSNYTDDGLHPNAKFYRLWAEELNRIIKR